MTEIKKLGAKNLKTRYINFKYAQGCKRKHEKDAKEMLDMTKNQMKL